MQLRSQRDAAGEVGLDDAGQDVYGGTLCRDDEVDADGATCRTRFDAPEIDGNLFIDKGFEGLNPGDIVTVDVDEAGEYDLWGRLV